jgi:hypothetical protein
MKEKIKKRHYSKNAMRVEKEHYLQRGMGKHYLLSDIFF